ncbi:hypothetical protein SAMN05444397_109139 [Flavobacterium aquidurense]|uniref:Uncharacterized protein n=1 Tax=Flavobacterium frigidimaris TaxID=262320 RepID=A0ABX4BQ56_FLAFR|nr:hypothetical protein [Flavobacterium frigidimaris]OXA78634.1 hypothetical protein B0A65_12950 [Flavobacterium frigidimaris]SDZ57842.1 hypothetical protein SAMN05444397_109139 [Flavobacterium aquidurense]
MMNKIYPLEWFDTLISQTLSPINPIIDKLSKKDFMIISEHIEKESKNIQNSLKKEIFLLRRKREVRLQVRKYHSNLVYLLDTIIEYQKTEFDKDSQFSSVFELLQNKLEELLLIVESRFSDYLSLDERVPITYLMLSRNELEVNLKRLSAKASENLNTTSLKIVIHNVIHFLGSFSKKKITYRQLLYHKDLLKGIKNIESSKEVNLFSEIDKVLIEKNFNSRDYIDYIIEHVKEEIEVEESLPNRITKLLFYQKEFDRIYSNEKISFDPCRNNIKYVLQNWFKQEINYFERNLEFNVKTNPDDEIILKPSNVPESKIECDLSADQIALILRAADESRIVKARSMNHFFKMIVPYLSTPFKKELSYQSVRSKSYNAEDRDKDIAIQTLEKIIKKINSY